MNKLDKMASKDAYEYGLAQMFFGEGAGTRRKLIEAVIEERINTVPGYEQALDKAYNKLSQIEMAEKAIAERKRIDRAMKTSKNFRALKSGRLNNLSTGLFVGVTAYMIARQTGLDKQIEAEVKKAYKRLKDEIEVRRAKAKLYAMEDHR